MAVPKRKSSKTRKRKRQTHWKTDAPSLVKCPKCRKDKLPHRVCPECGFYRDKEIIEVE